MEKQLSNEVMKILACPGCKGELKAKEGVLVCSGCGEKYEIKDGIPVLLPKTGQSKQKI